MKKLLEPPLPPQHSSTSPEIVIASWHAPHYPGGLEAYQRTLGRLLSEHTASSSLFLCGDDRHPTLPKPELAHQIGPWPVRQMEQLSQARVFRSLSRRLIKHPIAHPLLVAGLSRFWKPPEGVRPRVVHFAGTGGDLNGFAIAKWARHQGAKFTIWPAVHPRSWGDSPIDIRFYQLADTVFCQSHYEIKHLTTLGLDPVKLRLCGLPPMCRNAELGDGARLRARLGIGQRPAVFFLGRRNKGKGYPLLIKAWQHVLKSFPEAVLLLAGPPGGDEALTTLPPDSYRDLGMINECDKADAYAACQFFCLPSAYESFGIVYVEAWSFGKPVICGTAPASRELIEDGKTGLWADRRDPETLAEPIMLLLRSESATKRMGEEGRRVQQAHYTEERMLQAHLQAWE